MPVTVDDTHNISKITMIDRRHFGKILGILALNAGCQTPLTVITKKLNHYNSPSENVDLDGVVLKYLGANSLHIDDGMTDLLIDPFFSRPDIMGPSFFYEDVSPNIAAIKKCMSKASIDNLAAILITHSHFDHVMDAPEIAKMTGALLVGSDSTAQVGLGGGLDEKQIVVAGEEPMKFGDFTVEFIKSKHMPYPAIVSYFVELGKEITEPIIPPATGSQYHDGGAYDLQISHPKGTILCKGSAGFIDGSLENRTADVVLLSVGGLDFLDDDYRSKLFYESVILPNPQRLYFTHWDDFTIPLETLDGDFMRCTNSLNQLYAKAIDYDIKPEITPLWQNILLFD